MLTGRRLPRLRYRQHPRRVSADWAGLSFERLGEIKAEPATCPSFCTVAPASPRIGSEGHLLGISKINVNTDLQLVFARSVRGYIEAGKDQQGKGF